jgi:hypothetical protein
MPASQTESHNLTSASRSCSCARRSAAALTARPPSGHQDPACVRGHHPCSRVSTHYRSSGAVLPARRTPLMQVLPLSPPCICGCDLHCRAGARRCGVTAGPPPSPVWACAVLQRWLSLNPNTDFQSCSEVTQADTVVQSWGQKGSWFMKSRLGRALRFGDHVDQRLACCVIVCQLRATL